MKTLVVFYSRTGNTRKVGLELAEALGADVEEIIDTKDRSGIIGYIKSGKDAIKKNTSKIKKPQKDPGKYDLVILGSPIWGWTICPAFRTYVERFKNKIKNFSIFYTASAINSSNLRDIKELFNTKPKSTLPISVEEVNNKFYKEKIKSFISSIKSN